MSRLRLGHTRFTHSFLLKREDPPWCIPCHSSINVEHILIHCVDLALIRQKYYTVVTMKELFDTVDFKYIIAFLKESHLFHKFYN